MRLIMQSTKSCRFPENEYIGKGKVKVKDLSSGKTVALTPQWQSGWMNNVLAKAADFKHATSLAPKVAHSQGISPLYATEYQLKAEDGLPILGGRVVFAFPVDNPLTPPKNFQFGGFLYVFRAPAGTFYSCKGGVITHSSQVTFPYVIEPSDITGVYTFDDQKNAVALKWPP